MQVWMARSHQYRNCHWPTCGERIAKAEPMVTGLLNGSRIYWHPICWSEESISLLSPYEEPKRGRHPIDIPADKRIIRKKIIQSMSALRYRIRDYSSKDDNGKYALRIERMYIDIELLKRKLEDYGGVPGAWKKLLEVKF
jgi:hypothetical protein